MNWTLAGFVWLAALMAAIPAHAAAPFYDGKRITVIVNYPAGGPTDLEGRIVAQYLPAHLAGHPTIIVKNVGGAGGIIGSNQLGDAPGDGETVGFFTLDVPSQVLDNPAMRTPYSDFVLIAGVECPLVVYMRRDTPPGIRDPSDLMKADEFKALSLNAQNSNTINQVLALNILGVKYHAIPAYRGLKEVETAILQNMGQLANSSLSGWAGSIEPSMGDIVLPLWQLSPRRDGGYPRSKALPDLQTFEEFYAQVKPGSSLVDNPTYQALRAMSDPQLAMFRVALLPPHSSSAAIAVMRQSFIDLWQDADFLAAYSKVIKADPILVPGAEGQAILSGVAAIPPKLKQIALDSADVLTK